MFCRRPKRPDWVHQVVEMLELVIERQESILSNQDVLNQYVADLNAAIAIVAQEVSDLEAAVAAGATPESLDFTGANAALAALQAVEPATPPAA